MKKQINIALKEISERGLGEGIFSGISAAICVVQKRQRYRAFYSGGTTRLDRFGVEVEDSTLFDLASLTKPLCTTLCTLALVEAGRLKLHEKYSSTASRRLFRKSTDMTIQNILDHSSGLPAYQPYFLKFKPIISKNNTVVLQEKILNEPLLSPSGSTCHYSDLGFILLGQLIAERSEMPLNQYFHKSIVQPIQLQKELLFIPLNEQYGFEKRKIAATEVCPWRQKTMQGEVHDEHSWLMGGVAGHSGLFGTAKGVLKLCEFLLDCWLGKMKHPSFTNTQLQTALEWQSSAGGWHLGFDAPTPGISSSGRYFSPKSVGHLGFTGTSFWMDPVRGIIVVLLTNRVHPTRENKKIKEFRPVFHDYLMEKSGLIG